MENCCDNRRLDGQRIRQAALTLTVKPPSRPVFIAPLRSEEQAPHSARLAGAAGCSPERFQCCVERSARAAAGCRGYCRARDRKSTRLNSSNVEISYAVFCLKK